MNTNCHDCLNMHICHSFAELLAINTSFFHVLCINLDFGYRKCANNVNCSHKTSFLCLFPGRLEKNESFHSWFSALIWCENLLLSGKLQCSRLFSKVLATWALTQSTGLKYSKHSFTVLSLFFFFLNLISYGMSWSHIGPHNPVCCMHWEQSHTYLEE